MRLRWRALSRSTIARFVAVTFLSQGAVTGGVLLFVWRSTETTLLAEQKDRVAELRDDLLAGFREGGMQELVELIDARVRAVESTPPVILLAHKDGEVIAGNLAAWPAVVPKSTVWTAVTLYRVGSLRAEPMGVVATMLPKNYSLLTGHVIDSTLRLRKLNQEAILAAILLSVPLGLILAVLLGRAINVRVRAIAMTAEAVGAGDLSHRVRQDGSGDSFDALGHGVNTMLDQIETLVCELRIVTDGLAHDLRSPITRLKSTLERAIVDTKDPEAQIALEKAATEAETLLAMLSTALQVSRAEAGIGRERFTSTNVSTLLADLVELYGPAAEEQGMMLSVEAEPGLTVTLHRELISQAIGNLIENALKYARHGHKVVLAAVPVANGVLISVADDGPGIPTERHSEALKKFGRLDPARGISGAGLGLSLVNAVARLHRGELRLEDNAPGLKVMLTIKGSGGHAAM